jgi:hypothetical protein
MCEFIEHKFSVSGYVSLPTDRDFRLKMKGIIEKEVEPFTLDNMMPL